MSAPPGSATAALDLAQLTKRYGQRTVVGDLSLRVAEGEIFGILGPNGAGKTTTVECSCARSSRCCGGRGSRWCC